MVKTSKLSKSNIYGQCLDSQNSFEKVPWCNIDSVCNVATSNKMKLNKSSWNCNDKMQNTPYGTKLTDSQWEDQNWGCCVENHDPIPLKTKPPTCYGVKLESGNTCFYDGKPCNAKQCNKYINCPEGYVCEAIPMSHSTRNDSCRYKCVKLDNSCPESQVLGSDKSHVTGSTYEICKGGDIHHGSSHVEPHGSSHEEPPSPLGNKFCYYKGLCTTNYPSTFKCKKYDTYQECQKEHDYTWIWVTVLVSLILLMLVLVYMFAKGIIKI